MGKHETTLFKCLLLVYLITIVYIIHILHYTSFGQTKQLTEMELKRLNNRSILTRNVTEVKYVYRNLTKIVYVNNTIEKRVYRHNVNIPRYGPGENGTKVNAIQYGNRLNNTEMETKKTFYGFDTFMSDTVSLHRKLPDIRPPGCRTKHYPNNMPPVSVVIIFRDEWHSILLRTAYSVLEMSPPELLKEIVLVNDGSTDPEMIAKVELHVSNVDKFRLISNTVPLGIMKARQKGIDATTADYFIVIDGHMEVAPGWLEPLIHRLTQEPNSLLTSHFGVINHEHFETTFDDSGVGQIFPFFDPLSLDQFWAYYSREFQAKTNVIEPVPYGVVQGAMVVMRKKYFNQLGGFDPGMKVWGSEQMELSIKVWMCGGRVEMIPCSKVVHMYRTSPWTRLIGSEFYSLNKARTIDVWMDQPYREFVNQSLKYDTFTKGDLTDRLRLRRENQCKPYQFFVDTIKQFSDVYFPEHPKLKGAVYNTYFKRCLDKSNLKNKLKLILYPCHGVLNQYFLLTEYDELRTSFAHVAQAVRSDNSTKLEVVHSPSIVTRSEAKWDYKLDGRIVHKQSDLCLKAVSFDEVALLECTDDLEEIWEWGYVV